MEKIPVIIDSDPGIDDFFAIMLANSCEKFDIKAITTVAGNQTSDIVTDNAQHIAGLFQMDSKVVRGAQNPLAIELRTAGSIHGNNGLGNVKIDATPVPLSDGYAWDTIYQCAVESKGTLEIIAIGPLTNIATALLKYPDLGKYVSRIVMMGGSAGVGNVSPYGEFNAVVDPLATKIVFQSGIPLVMVGWDITSKSGLTPDEVNSLVSIKSRHSETCAAILHFLQSAYAGLQAKDIVLSDALAVAYAMNPDVLKCHDYYVSVETNSALNMGRTIVDFEHVCSDMPLNCSVATEVDKDVYISILSAMMHFYA